MSSGRSLESDLLLLRDGEGNSHARAELLERYRARLRRMIAMRLDPRVAGRVDASDVVQDVMKDAHERLPDYLADPQISFYPWLRRIACDRLTDMYRTHVMAEKRTVLKEHPWSLNLNDESVAEFANSIVASSIGPSERAVQDELQARAAAALLQLNPPDREILVLRYLEQLGVAEIAEVLEISETAVTSRHLRALQRLRRLLDDK